MKLSIHFYQLLTYLCILILLPACGGGGGGTTGGTRVIYVSDTSGDDTFNGSRPSSAKKTISAGISVASGSTQVRVAGGTYAITTSIVLAPDVSILGGYSTDFVTRDAASNVTTIRHTVNSAAVNTVIEANDVRIDSGTIVDGFTIDGGNSTTQSFGADIIVGSPTIQNNNIIGGQGSDRHGIRVRGGSPVIDNNVITNARIGISISGNAETPEIKNNTITADSDFITIGININGLSGTTNVVIDNNTIYGGNATGGFSYSIGVWTSANTTTITNNTIDGGSSSDSSDGKTTGIRGGGGITAYNNIIYGGDGAGQSFGIEDYSAANFYNNTIDGGSGVVSYAVYIDSLSTTSSLKNNILMATSGTSNYCLYEDANAPLEVNNNNFINCSTAIFYDDDALCTGDGDGDTNDNTCTIAEMEALVDITNGASGNVSLDPMFTDIDGADDIATTMADNDWHLTGASPANVFEGGLDLSASFTTDFDALTRTAVIANAPSNVGAAAGAWGHLNMISITKVR